MNGNKYRAGRIGIVSASVWMVAFAGCTTYVQQSPPRTVYVPAPVEQPAPPVYVVTPPANPVVVIQSENDFYQPLSPYGQWVVVSGYGRCWRPARVEFGWRPYCNGHWQRCDAGWYWASEEPWGWATYHYGRWVLSSPHGWVWVPQTQWAPAWVAWREGEGYVGWAPLPPSAVFGVDGAVEVRDTTFARRSFVFVEERQMLEPVRPTTVIVNNVTVVNKTKNITRIKVVNKNVVNEGPRTEVVERASGQKVQAAAVHELRHQEESEHVARQRNRPAGIEQGAAPTAKPALPEREKTARAQSQQQIEAENKAKQDAKAEAERVAALKRADERKAEAARADELKRTELEQKAAAERAAAQKKEQERMAEVARAEALRKAQQERQAEAERAQAAARAQQEKEKAEKLQAQKAEEARQQQEKAAKKAAQEQEQAQKKLEKQQQAEKAAAEKAAKKKAEQERAQKRKDGEKAPEQQSPTTPPPPAK